MATVKLSEVLKGWDPSCGVCGGHGILGNATTSEHISPDKDYLCKPCLSDLLIDLLENSPAWWKWKRLGISADGPATFEADL